MTLWYNIKIENIKFLLDKEMKKNTYMVHFFMQFFTYLLAKFQSSVAYYLILNFERLKFVLFSTVHFLYCTMCSRRESIINKIISKFYIYLKNDQKYFKFTSHLYFAHYNNEFPKFLE